MTATEIANLEYSLTGKDGSYSSVVPPIGTGDRTVFVRVKAMG